MTTDPLTFLGAATRTVSTRDDGAKVLVATRRYDTSIEDLWDALTSAERIPRWLLPISGELRLGGRYQLVAMRAARSSAASRRARSA